MVSLDTRDVCLETFINFHKIVFDSEIEPLIKLLKILKSITTDYQNEPT